MSRLVSQIIPPGGADKSRIENNRTKTLKNALLGLKVITLFYSMEKNVW